MTGTKLACLLLGIFLLLAPLAGCCGNTNQSVAFSQLISRADRYNGKTVNLEAFFFSGFEISVIAETVGPATSGAWRIVPTGTLVWVKSGITEKIFDKLYRQTTTPSGYPENIGKLRITGTFETGGKYGHMNAYNYQIAITNAELMEWTPPPAADN
jgi:hypothetical protein